MAEKVHVKKLNFIHHLKYLESSSLAQEIYSLQVNCHFPGLVNECRKLLKLYCIPDIIDSKIDISKEYWKKTVKTAVRRKSEEKIKNEMLSYTKLKEIGKSWNKRIFKNHESERFKDYVQNQKFHDKCKDEQKVR